MQHTAAWRCNNVKPARQVQAMEWPPLGLSVFWLGLSTLGHKCSSTLDGGALRAYYRVTHRHYTTTSSNPQSLIPWTVNLPKLPQSDNNWYTRVGVIAGGCKHTPGLQLPTSTMQPCASYAPDRIVVQLDGLGFGARGGSRNCATASGRDLHPWHHPKRILWPKNCSPNNQTLAKGNLARRVLLFL